MKWAWIGALRLLLGMGLVTGTGGCALFGAAAAKIMGPDAVPARYTPPQEPMLVLVEDANRSSGMTSEAEELAMVLHEELKENKVAPLIDPGQLHRLRDEGPVAYRHMKITDIGHRVGARQVLYVALQRLELDSPQGSGVVRAKIAASVKVVGVEDGTIRWPQLSDGEVYEFETPFVALTPQNNPTVVQSAVIRQAGVDIGRMFYKWKPQTMKEENPDVKIR